MTITNEQLAELLVGVARSQQAIIDAVAMHLGHNAGLEFRGRSLIPVLQDYANVRQRGVQPPLHDLPSRILLRSQGQPAAGAQPLEAWVAEEMGRLVP